MTRVNGLPCIDGHEPRIQTAPGIRRWACSCGQAGKDTKREQRARVGAVAHVARMERSR